MTTRTCRVGVHGRNQEVFHETDYQVIREANLEVIKMMSLTRPEVFDRIKRENPGIEIITRLYDDRMNTGGHPTPKEFADRMIPIMKALKPYCTKFQVHNEPNHRDRIEGWGPNDEDAQSFNEWFLKVYDLLKAACPWASLGFPGLAMPTFIHRDRAWLRICKPAIERADWLGVHSYWQTPPDRPSVIFDPQFGLTYKYYHKQYPDKVLEILECGNSNVQSGWAISDDVVAQEYVKWLQELFKHDYVNSASFFLLSSPDPQWAFFSWRTEHNHKKPVVHQVRQMHRPSLVSTKRAEPRPKPRPKPRPRPREGAPEAGEWTNQQIITAFHDAAVKLGLGNWALMKRAGIKLADLVRDRSAPYQGPAIEQLPRLTDEQKDLILSELEAQVSAAVSFGLEGMQGFLWQQEDLAAVSLALPRAQRIDLASAKNSIERRVARTWNRYSYLLIQVADLLGLDLAVATAVLSAQANRRGVARNGRLVIRFENHIFYEKWGQHNEEAFRQHFRFGASRPWTKHQWRPHPDDDWRDCHRNQRAEWEVFDFACTLDETAAKLSVGQGLAQMMGFNYASIGYESVGHMFDALSSGERYQVLAIFDLIAGPSASSRQLEALQDQDLLAFAGLHYGSRRAARVGSRIHRLFQAFQALNP
ncbi:MAG: N-acetylmuramidase domain-containing protein, partial [Anaerolineae bacterium]